MNVLPRAKEEGQRRMLNVSIAIKMGIARQIVGQREEERKDEG